MYNRHFAWNGWTANLRGMSEVDPGSIDAICMTARSCEPTGLYCRPRGGLIGGLSSSVLSISFPFSIITTNQSIKETHSLSASESRTNQIRLGDSDPREGRKEGRRRKREVKRDANFGPWFEFWTWDRDLREAVASARRNKFANVERKREIRPCVKARRVGYLVFISTKIILYSMVRFGSVCFGRKLKYCL